MGSISSTSTNPTSQPSSQPTTSTPNSPSPSPADYHKSDPQSRNPVPKTSITPASELSDETQDSEEVASEEAEGEGEGECGFCLFMKAGGCRESFIAWEKCVEEPGLKEEPLFKKCHEITVKLKKCMVEHSDYYAPVMKLEKEMEEEAARELEPGEERKKDEGNVGS